ncbi:MAG: DUF342 domain-containing protein [Oscillospiraceae bacterium]
MEEIIRIVEGDSFEQCLEKAAAVLQREKQEVCLEVLEEGQPGKPWQAAAVSLENKSMLSEMDGTYHLFYEDDGVYLEILPARGSGAEVDRAEMLLYIGRKKIQQQDAIEIAAASVLPYCRIKIAPPQEEFYYSAEALVTISGDDMEACLEFLPPEEGGEKMTFDQAVSVISEKGVVYGIDDDIIKKLISEEIYNKKVCFARGIPAQDGIDGEIIFHFEVEHSGTPTIDKDGSVDYRTLDLFATVKAGEKLAEKKPATQGTPGYTVKGRELKPRNGKEAKLPKGKNIWYDDTQMNAFAKISGRADYINRMIIVSDCYTIKGDADLSVGNIDFDGDVVVMGNVISELTIKASGSIEVFGTVEGAKLSAGTNIVLRRGMQGNDKGMLEAGENIFAKYIERSVVQARGRIAVDSMIHCHAESGDSITASGRHGCIIGGSAKAQNSISAQSLGSVSGNRTDIAVGIAPMKRTRLKFVHAEIDRLKDELDKLEKAGKYLSQTENITEKQQLMKKSVVLGKIRNVALIKEYTEEIKKTEQDVQSASIGRVHVKDTVYPGVKISISFGEMNVTSPIKFATFKYGETEISVTPCQM